MDSVELPARQAGVRLCRTLFDGREAGFESPCFRKAHCGNAPLFVPGRPRSMTDADATLAVSDPFETGVPNLDRVLTGLARPLVTQRDLPPTFTSDQ
jgi:hypothetical protein